MLVIGETLIKGTSDAPSPWFERCGDAATFNIQLISLSANTALDVTVQTKNRTDHDSSASDLGSLELTSEGVASVRVTGMQELVRFTYSVVGIPAPVPPTISFAHFQVLPPAWENNELQESGRVSDASGGDS